MIKIVNGDNTAELTTRFLDAANPEKARHLMRFFKTGEGNTGTEISSSAYQFRSHAL